MRHGKDNISIAFLIQGVFWQKRQWLDTALEPIEGYVAVIKTGVVEFMYQGAVCASPESLLGEMSGSTTDHFGRSQITKFVMEQSRLSFVKQYGDKPYGIAYVFPVKKGNIWEGYYEGPSNVGCGLTRCVVTEVPMEFFDPSALLERMKKFCPKLGQARV